MIVALANKSHGDLGGPLALLFSVAVAFRTNQALKRGSGETGRYKGVLLIEGNRCARRSPGRGGRDYYSTGFGLYLMC